jgi:hypothetical protein
MRQCGNIWYSRTGHRWQYNTAYAFCMLDNYGYRHRLRIWNTYCFPRQKWLRERASMLRLSVHYLSRYFIISFSVHSWRIRASHYPVSVCTNLLLPLAVGKSLILCRNYSLPLPAAHLACYVPTYRVMYPFSVLCTHLPCYVPIYRVMYPFSVLCTHLACYVPTYRVMYPFSVLCTHLACYVPIYRVMYPLTVLCTHLPCYVPTYRVMYPFSVLCTHLACYVPI